MGSRPATFDANGSPDRNSRSLIAAAGMNDRTGLMPCGSLGNPHRSGGRPGLFIEP